MTEEQKAEEYANEYGQDAFTQAHMPETIDYIRMVRKQGYIVLPELKENE